MKMLAVLLMLAGTDWPSAIKTVTPSVVPLTHEHGGARLPACTAIVIGRRSVLTAKHCLDDDGYTAIFVDNMEAKPVGLEAADLVVLDVGQEPARWRPICVRPGLPKQGDRVGLLGYGFGSYLPVFMEGVVSGLSTSNLGAAEDGRIAFDLMVLMNHSGSPIFDSQGRLIAVAQAASRSPDGGLIAHSDRPAIVRELIEKAQQRERQARKALAKRK